MFAMLYFRVSQRLLSFKAIFLKAASKITQKEFGKNLKLHDNFYNFAWIRFSKKVPLFFKVAKKNSRSSSITRECCDDAIGGRRTEHCWRADHHVRHGGVGRLPQLHRIHLLLQHDLTLQGYHRSSEISHLNVHCNENPIYVFLFWELRGLCPNIHINVSVSYLKYLYSQDPSTYCAAASLADVWE